MMADMKFGALCLRGWAALFLAILAGPASGEPIPGQTYADIEFHAEAEPQTDPAGGSVVLLYWSNPGRNSYRVQSSDDLETWATVLEGYSFADDQSFVPVYIAAPSVGVAPPKPLRTVSLRETTTGWFASWVDVVNDDPVWCLQPLAVPPPEFDGYIYEKLSY